MPTGERCRCRVAGEFLAELLHEVRTFGPRPDQAHVSAQHVPQLRQLVQRRAAQQICRCGLIRSSPATLHSVADSRSSAGRSVRNFSSVNGPPPRPTRSCRKITPGPSEIRTASAQAASTGAATSSAGVDQDEVQQPLAPTPAGPRALQRQSPAGEAPHMCRSGAVRPVHTHRAAGPHEPSGHAALVQQPGQEGVLRLLPGGVQEDDVPDGVLDDRPGHVLQYDDDRQRSLVGLVRRRRGECRVGATASLSRTEVDESDRPQPVARVLCEDSGDRTRQLPTAHDECGPRPAPRPDALRFRARGPRAKPASRAWAATAASSASQCSAAARSKAARRAAAMHHATATRAARAGSSSSAYVCNPRPVQPARVR